MKTKIIVTIDTEFSTHRDDMGIWGNIGGKDHGVPLIRAVLDKHRVKGTFFVDVYTDKAGYIGRFRDLCVAMLKDGHDFELHTHPNGLFDRSRGSMNDYSLDEQVRIIEKGKQIFQDWFGFMPVAHRAGDWGADRNTIKALALNGIFCDCSSFFGWKKCRLGPDVPSVNMPFMLGDMYEIPATVFNSFSVLGSSPYRLVSTNGNSLPEIKWVTEQLLQRKVPVISLVYHSFSFLKWDKKRTNYAFSAHELCKFETYLQWLALRADVEFVTVADMVRCSPAFSGGQPDFEPRSGWAAFPARVWDRLRK